MSSIIIYCRTGFENDAAAEITHHATKLEVGGFVKAKPNSGYIIFQCYQASDADLIIRKVSFSDMVFARQWFAGVLLKDMPIEDRVGEIAEAVKNFPACGELRAETPDSNEGKELLTFCKKISVPLRHKLTKQVKLLKKPSKTSPILHVMFLANNTAYVGYSYQNNNSEFFMGIPRLKMPSDGPSRSTLKLDEAFMVFIPEDEKDQRIIPGMRAVDLGACPGGWTYQLVRRGMFVQAIDNGPMNASLMETGQVQHFKVDGFKFRPEKRNIDWLVCDMVEKPAKVTNLMIDWAANDFVKELIFNLKLPMKKRFDSVYENLSMIRSELKRFDIQYELQAKHLYHDREEITVHLRVLKVPQKLYS